MDSKSPPAAQPAPQQPFNTPDDPTKLFIERHLAINVELVRACGFALGQMPEIEHQVLGQTFDDTFVPGGLFRFHYDDDSEEWTTVVMFFLKDRPDLFQKSHTAPSAALLLPFLQQMEAFPALVPASRKLISLAAAGLEQALQPQGMPAKLN